VGGFVRANFRLDSVAQGGDVAYVSMRGTLQQRPSSGASAEGSVVTGSVNGSMIVDRRRGWLSESRFVVQMATTVASRGGAKITPMQFRMKIRQHMRVFAKR